MRRRSYGNSVSARNRQRILLQTHRLKVRVMRTRLINFLFEVCLSIGKEIIMIGFFLNNLDTYRLEKCIFGAIKIRD